MSQVFVMYETDLAEILVELEVWVVDHDVEGEALEHDLLVRENTVTPSPIFLGLLVNDEPGVLLGHLRYGDDDVFRFPAVLLGLVRKEEGGGGNVLYAGFYSQI